MHLQVSFNFPLCTISSFSLDPFGKFLAKSIVGFSFFLRDLRPKLSTLTFPELCLQRECFVPNSKFLRDSRIAIDLTFSLRGEEYFKAGNLQFIVTLTRVTFVVSLICPLYDQEDFGDVHFKAFHFMININSSREKKATRKPLPQYGNFCRAAK